MTYDYLIVGAGFSGCVLSERIAAILGKTVLLIDSRNHLGGNSYDCINSDGILIHKYGPHWFHTNSPNIIAYLSQFTDWRMHDHRVRAHLNGSLFPLPINMDTINQLYGFNFSTEAEVIDYYNSVKIPTLGHSSNAEDFIVSQVGVDLYNRFYKNYTKKQWGIDPKKLPASITSRLPIRSNRDDRYFSDSFQAIPYPSYSALFTRMTKSERIEIALNTDYKQIANSVKYNHLIYTGPIDTFFDNHFGRLEYRSLRFEHETYDTEYYQDFQQINYPNNYQYTRIVEWKHATGQKHPKTTITKEYPYLAGDNDEKFYPILTKENLDKLSRYQSYLSRFSSITMCGRLADYKYYNMDQIVGRALSVFEKSIAKVKPKNESQIYY